MQHVTRWVSLGRTLHSRDMVALANTLRPTFATVETVAGPDGGIALPADGAHRHIRFTVPGPNVADGAHRHTVPGEIAFVEWALYNDADAVLRAIDAVTPAYDHSRRLCVKIVAAVDAPKFTDKGIDAIMAAICDAFDATAAVIENAGRTPLLSDDELAVNIFFGFDYTLARATLSQPLLHPAGYSVRGFPCHRCDKSKAASQYTIIGGGKYTADKLLSHRVFGVRTCCDECLYDVACVKYDVGFVKPADATNRPGKRRRVANTGTPE